MTIEQFAFDRASKEIAVDHWKRVTSLKRALGVKVMDGSLTLVDAHRALMIVQDTPIDVTDAALRNYIDNVGQLR